MKDSTKSKQSLNVNAVPKALLEIARHVIIAALGFLASRVMLLGNLTPLGLILTGAVPQMFSLSSGVGAFVGYLFFPNTETPFRYIAALFSVICIRLLTKQFKNISTHAAFYAFVVLLSNTVCNLVTCMNDSSNVLLLLAEGVLSGGITYFVARALQVDFSLGVGLTGEELASVIITVDLILLSIMPINIFSLSLGRILSVSLILAASRFGFVSGGAISGAAVGFAIALGLNNSELVTVYAIGGLISGLFSSAGRLLGVLGFIVPSIISLGIFGFSGSTITLLIEMALGIAIFLLLPKNVCVTLASLFLPPVKLESLDGMRKSLVMRLNLASGALSQVSETIEEVSKRLKKINSPDASVIFDRCEKEACIGCSFRIDCWETNRSETLRTFGRLSSGIRERNDNLIEYAPEFYDKCLRSGEMEMVLKRNYNEYLSKLRAEERIEQVRGVVSDQFDGISDMLLDLAQEFDNARSYDLDTAGIVVASLRDINLLTTDCGCSVDALGRLTIDARIKSISDQAINRRQILEQLENTLEKRFEPPKLKYIEDTIYMTVKERANFQVEVGVAQIPATETGICGDAYEYFGDGQGRFIMIISDGMGTGGRAAVDGAMTAGLIKRLICAGFGFDCSLKIVNSALLYKSTEESLSTLDITAFDLYTGETKLFKAGAAPTLVRRGGRVGRAESHSLPVGILRDVGFDRSSFTLKVDDIVVMLSDGVSVLGTDWVVDIIEHIEECSAQHLADTIADAALRRCDKRHPDDITVMVSYINKKV